MLHHFPILLLTPALHFLVQADWQRFADGMETDELLDSILTGSNREVQNNGFDRPLSDTSSDSGCNLEQQILSPDLGDCIPNHEDEDEDESSQAVVNPRTNSPEPETVSFDTGATTIILPVITPVSY